MNHPSVADRFLHFATRVAIRILPKEAKVVVKKYKKYRLGRGVGLKEIEAMQKMPPKGNKKKSSSNQAQVLEASPESIKADPEVKEALIEQFKKMSLEGGKKELQISNPST